MPKKVMLTRPGIKAVGEYEAGIEYEVEDSLAEILVKVKGFEYVTAASAAPAQMTQTAKQGA
jgi:5'-3' exonuclease